MLWNVEIPDGRESRKNLSPFNKAFMQMTDTITNTGLDVRTVEPEASYLEYLQPSVRRLEYWNNLGSSKSRNKQEEETRRIIDGQIKSEGKDVIYGFTDGSWSGRVGGGGGGGKVLALVEQVHACFYQTRRESTSSNLFPEDLRFSLVN